MQKQYKVTKERLKELHDELKYLKTVREKEVAEQIKEARSFGDLSENSEYDEAKNEQGKLYSRIAEIEAILNDVMVISDEDLPTDRVRLGCRVLVRDLDTGEEEQYQVVGSLEAKPAEGRISDEAPFGKALMGKKVNEEVNVNAPDGSLIRYQVLGISR